VKLLFTETEYYDEQFKEIRFSKEKLDSVNFYDCTFTNCEFGETLFIDCKFSGCRFTNCNLNLIKVVDCHLSQVSFSECKLIGINWTEAIWPKISIPGILAFEECTLNHSTFIGLELQHCIIRKCMAKDVDFREADFTKADMSSTDFSESIFGETNLTTADFSFATNYQIDPSCNRIKNAIFMLPEAISLLYCMDIHLKEE
jgi:fluoroquinolone resistance protein